jgi:hypothetical protein
MVADIAKPIVPKLRQRRFILDLLTKSQIRNAYLYGNSSQPEIADRVSAPLGVVRAYITRAKLPAEKRRRETKAIQVADARASAELTSNVIAIVDQAEELQLNGLRRAAISVESKDPSAPKDFQAWTGGVRNLAQVARLARADAPIEASGSISISLFNVKSEREPKQAEVVEVEAKQLPAT